MSNSAIPPILYAMDEAPANTMSSTGCTMWKTASGWITTTFPPTWSKGLSPWRDKRFPYHHGVDWKRTIRAAVNLFIPIYEGKPGGSTITQQLIKNVTGDNALRVDRKVREIFQALNLESATPRNKSWRPT